MVATTLRRLTLDLPGGLDSVERARSTCALARGTRKTLTRGPSSMVHPDSAATQRS